MGTLLRMHAWYDSCVSEIDVERYEPARTRFDANFWDQSFRLIVNGVPMALTPFG